MNPALAKWVSQHAASELARVSAQPESAPLSLSAEQVTEAAQQLGLSEAQVRSELLAFDRALRAAVRTGTNAYAGNSGTPMGARVAAENATVRHGRLQGLVDAVAIGKDAVKCIGIMMGGAFSGMPDTQALLGVMRDKSPEHLRALDRACAVMMDGKLLSETVGLLLQHHQRNAVVSPEIRQARIDLADVICALRGVQAQSGLGRTVAGTVLASNIYKGTVPPYLVVTTQNRFVGAYVDAKEIFTAKADLIASAKYEVCYEGFEWDPSTFNKKNGKWVNDPTMVLLDGVQRLQARLQSEEASGQKPHLPVKCYFAIDGDDNEGGLAVDKARNLLRQLAALGVDPKYVEVHAGAHERRVWGACHSKNIIVDGYRGITTGANAQQFQTMNRSWHDTGYGIEGAAGVGMARNFDDTWANTQEITWSDARGAPPHTTPPGLASLPWLLRGGAIELDVKMDIGGFCEIADVVKVLGSERKDLDAVMAADKGRCFEVRGSQLRLCLKKHKTRAIDHHPQAKSPPLDQLVGGNAHLPITLATRRPFDPLKTGLDPRAIDNPQNMAFVAMLQAATTVVKIESPNMNNIRVMEEIKEALRRGVEVQLVLSLGFNAEAERQEFNIPVINKKLNAGGANEDIIFTLYEGLAPAERARLKMKWHSHDKKRPTWGQEMPGATHTKYMSVDETATLVGSANQDNASWIIARELNFVLDDKAATAECDARVFDVDFKKGIDVFAFARAIVAENGAPPLGLAGNKYCTQAAFDRLLRPNALQWANRVVAMAP